VASLLPTARARTPSNRAGALPDFDKRCDQNLIEIMPTATASTPSQAGKNAGLLALLYFSTAERNLALGEILFKGTRKPD
jgi:hypothetical protein